MQHRLTFGGAAAEFATVYLSVQPLTATILGR
jgi:hypothetical protein